MSHAILNAPAHNENRPDRSGRVILIASGKGGVGKTWFSITLAQALAARGKRVLLFDGDLGLANVDIQLGLTPAYDLRYFIDGQCPLKDVVTPFTDGGFDIIAGRSGCGDLASLPPMRLRMVRDELQKLAGDYDITLVDLGAGVGGTVRSLMAVADECYVVTTDEPTSITDAYAFIKMARIHDSSLTVQLMINQAEYARSGEQTYETLKKTCETFLSFTPALLGVVRRCARVKESIRSQSPLLKRHPASIAGSDVIRLAQKVCLK